MSVSDGVVISIRQRTDGSIVDLAHAEPVVFGWRPSDIPNVGADMLLHPDDRVVAHRSRLWAAASAKTQVVNLRLRTPGGRWQWVEATVSPCELDDGSPGTITAMRDISDMTMHQESLGLVVNLRGVIDAAPSYDAALREVADRVRSFLGFDRGYVWTRDIEPRQTEPRQTEPGETETGETEPGSQRVAVQYAVGDVAAVPEIGDDSSIADVFEQVNVDTQRRTSHDPRAARAVSEISAARFPVVAQGKVLAVFEFESEHEIGPSAIGLATEAVAGVGDALEHKRVQLELDLARQQLVGAFNDAPIGMAFVSPDGRFVRVNRSLSEFLERTPEQMLALTFQEITHPDDLGDDVAVLNEVLAGKRQRYQREKRYLRPDGSTVWALLSTSVVRDRNGEPLHFIAQVVDISAQKAREFQLAQGGGRQGCADVLAADELAEQLSTFLQSTVHGDSNAAVVVISIRPDLQLDDAAIAAACTRVIQMIRADDFFVRASTRTGMVLVSSLSPDADEARQQLDLMVDRLVTGLAARAPSDGDDSLLVRAHVVVPGVDRVDDLLALCGG